MKTILDTTNDVETMNIFKKFKTTITLANVELMLTIGLTATHLIIASRSKFKSSSGGLTMSKWGGQIRRFF